MLTRQVRAAAFALLIVAPVVALREGQGVAAQVPTASDAPKYVLPPQPIVDLFDAEFLPQTTVSPNQQVVALTKARAYPTIAELAQPMLRLAGARVNPKTNGPHRASGAARHRHLLDHAQEDRRRRRGSVTMPPQARISHMKFSPDGSRLAFLHTEGRRHRVVGRGRRHRRRKRRS
jgi:hypothetical protein